MLFHWPDPLDNTSESTLRRWWASAALRVAVAIELPDEQLLITHAGLTHGFWAGALRRSRSATRAAHLLNTMRTSGSRALFRPGRMLTQRRPNRRAGPLWAEASSELIGSWLGREMPFSQIHGHSSILDWDDGYLRTLPVLENLVIIDGHSRHTVTHLPGGRLIGVDPGHDRQKRNDWRAFLLHVVSADSAG